MVTLPWTTNTATDTPAESVVLGSRLELRSLGDTVRFLRGRYRSASKCSRRMARSACR